MWIVWYDTIGPLAPDIEPSSGRGFAFLGGEGGGGICPPGKADPLPQEGRPPLNTYFGNPPGGIEPGNMINGGRYASNWNAH